MSRKDKFYSRELRDLARFSKALSHPARLYILDFLSENSERNCYSGDLAEKLPIARSTISQHLTELKSAGLIQDEINLPFIRYSINKKAWTEARKMYKNFLAGKTDKN